MVHLRRYLITLLIFVFVFLNALFLENVLVNE